MKKINLIVVLLVFALASCEKPDLEVADSNVPVVESYIHPGNAITVNISKQLVYNSSDTACQYLDSLEVYLSDSNDVYLLQCSGDGTYENPDVLVQENMDYLLEFNYNDKNVSASTSVPLKPESFTASSATVEVFSFENFDPGSGMPEMPDPIILSWDNPDQDYFMIVAECTEEDPVLINSDTDKPQRSFRSSPNQGSEQQIQGMTFTYYGDHRLILYKLNPEYAALYESIEATSLDIEAPPSNVENGLGIFTGINSDTLNIEVVEM